MHDAEYIGLFTKLEQRSYQTFIMMLETIDFDQVIPFPQYCDDCVLPMLMTVADTCFDKGGGVLM